MYIFKSCHDKFLIHDVRNGETRSIVEFDIRNPEDVDKLRLHSKTLNENEYQCFKEEFTSHVIGKVADNIAQSLIGTWRDSKKNCLSCMNLRGPDSEIDGPIKCSIYKKNKKIITDCEEHCFQA